MKDSGEQKYTGVAEGCLPEEIQSQIQADSKGPNNQSLSARSNVLIPSALMKLIGHLGW